MLRQIKKGLADRTGNPLLQLLILDWRFSCLLVLAASIVLVAIGLPAKIWKRSPGGFHPVVRISALDRLQAYSLSRSAVKAEKRGETDLAIQGWSAALANDPCNERIAANCVKALLRSKKANDATRALQVAGWLREFAPGPMADQLFILAADRNRAWDLVLEKSEEAMIASENRAVIHVPLARALFQTKRFAEAKKEAEDCPGASRSCPCDLYGKAAECILSTRTAGAATCVELKQRVASVFSSVEAHEAYLMTCAEKRDVGEFRAALVQLKAISDETLEFDILHVRLLWDLGRWREARAEAGLLQGPTSARETVRLAETFIILRQRDEALAVLRRYCSEFPEWPQAWILYARLLLEQRERDELRVLRQTLQHQTSPALSALGTCIAAYVDPSPGKIEEVKAALRDFSMGRFDPGICFFAADALTSVGRAEAACEILQVIEPQNLRNPEFYRRLFAAAEANRDAALMRRIAERSYQLSPEDPLALSNHAAMLILFEEEPERAVALTESFQKMQPDSLAARINHAAALINLDLFGPADAILRNIQDEGLSNNERNQFRFIQLKRAVKLGDKHEALRLEPLIDRAGLYSVQADWLERNRI